VHTKLYIYVYITIIGLIPRALCWWINRHQSSHSFCCGDDVAQYLILCVVVRGSLFGTSFTPPEYPFGTIKLIFRFSNKKNQFRIPPKPVKKIKLTFMSCMKSVETLKFRTDQHGMISSNTLY